MKNIIIIHHTAVSYKKSSNQFNAVKNYHISKGWGDIGYHYFIEKNGEIKNGRNEESVGAHCYQKEMNYKSIGICLAGHFDEENPTSEQYAALKDLIANIEKKNGKCEIFLHNHFASYKTCPGNNFDFNQIYNTLSLSSNSEFMDEKTVKILKEKQVKSIAEALSVLWNLVDKKDQRIVSEMKKQVLEL